MYKSIFRRELLALTLLLSLSLAACDLFTWPPHVREDPLDGPGVMTLSYGDFAYRLGGQDGNGVPGTRVEMATLDGEGNPGVWSSTSDLPEGRAHGAVFAAGNKIYVLGGFGPEGASRDIYYSHIQSDGSIGILAERKWEKNLRPLPEARAAASSLYHDGRILLAGGQEADGQPVDTMIHARLYQDGQIGQWYESPETLTAAAAYPELALRAGRLYAAADDRAESWAVGSSFLLGDRRDESGLEPGFFEPGPGPAAPVLMPGSGLVPPRTTLAVTKGPGTTLRFRRDGGEVTSADPEWTPGYELTVAEHFDFRIFDAEGNPSTQVSADYSPRSTGFLVFSQATIPATDDPWARTTCLMDGTISWFSFRGTQGQPYAFAFDDAASAPGNPANTGTFALSLFESDYYSPVLDREGKSVIDMPGSSPAREFVAGPGVYYLLASETATQPDRSFSAAFMAR